MKIKIYQMDLTRNLEHLKNRKAEVKQEKVPAIDASLYDLVFTGDVDCEDLEDVFLRFNRKVHPLHRGRRLSVSDIVVTERGAFFCDVIGFGKVAFDESKAHRPDNLMKIVYVEPHRKPFVSEIENQYKAMSKAVCGLIEEYPNRDGTVIVLNEEGKIIGMEGNRRVGDGSTILAGPFFIVGVEGDSFRSLTEEEIARYLQRFDEVEKISQQEVAQDTWLFIGAWNGGIML